MSIRFKSGAYTEYVSILNRIATQPSDTRWGFETTSEKEKRTYDHRIKI
jgi:hypothetical protein